MRRNVSRMQVSASAAAGARHRTGHRAPDALRCLQTVRLDRRQIEHETGDVSVVLNRPQHASDGGDAAKWRDFQENRDAQLQLTQCCEKGAQMSGIREEVAAVLGIWAA